MLRRLLLNKGFWALALPLAICGAVWAGGEDCHHKGAAAHAGKGMHCNLGKNVSKTARMTEDGAVVSMEGKTEEAVKHIQAHLEKHNEEGAGCPGCPASREDVEATVKVTDKGGEITLTGKTPEAIKAVQEWASKPGACCSEGKSHT